MDCLGLKAPPLGGHTEPTVSDAPSSRVMPPNSWKGAPLHTLSTRSAVVPPGRGQAYSEVAYPGIADHQAYQVDVGDRADAVDGQG